MECAKAQHRAAEDCEADPILREGLWRGEDRRVIERVKADRFERCWMKKRRVRQSTPQWAKAAELADRAMALEMRCR